MAFDLEDRAEVKVLVKPLPSFFIDLFQKATIIDVSKQRDYAAKLLKEDIHSAESLLTVTKDELKTNFGMTLGEADLILKAAQAMTAPTTSSSHPLVAS